MVKKPRQLHESFRPCRDYMIAMVPLVGMAWYLYGLRAPVLIVLSLFVAFLCDVLAATVQRVKYDPSDLSSYMFAMVFTIMLPASSRYEIIIIGTAVTVLLGKHAFGGYGAYPFNPAAFGFAFASICWPNAVYMYPSSFSSISLAPDSGADLHTSVASALKHGGVPIIDNTDFILGNYAGPMGTTFCLIILSCLVLLIVHGAMTWHIPVMYLSACAAWAVVFPRVPTGILSSLMLEMFSGAIIFAAVFIVAEPTTAPVNPKAKIVYGLLLGLGTMIFRTYGAYEMGVCFAILLLNPLSSYLDRKLAPRAHRTRGAKI